MCRVRNYRYQDVWDVLLGLVFWYLVFKCAIISDPCGRIILDLLSDRELIPNKALLDANPSSAVKFF